MDRHAIASRWVTPFIGDNPFYYIRHDNTMQWEKALCAGEYSDREFASIAAEDGDPGNAPNGISDILFTGFNLEDIPANSIINSMTAVFYVQVNGEHIYCDQNYNVGFYSGTKCCAEYSLKDDLGGKYIYGKSRTVDLTDKVTAADLADFGIRLSVEILRGASGFSYTYGGCSLHINYTPGVADKTGHIQMESKDVVINLGNDSVNAIYMGNMKLY